MKKLITLVLIISVGLHAQEIDDLVFFNQPIRDILQVLGTAGNITIVSDETVDGQTSFQAQGMEIRNAINLLLETNRLYGIWEESILYVSRVQVELGDSGHVSLDAENAQIEDIILALSRKAGKSIIFDALPRENLTLHIQKQPLREITGIIIRRFPDYQLESDDNYLYIRQKRDQSKLAGSAFLPEGTVRREGNNYSLDIEQERFPDVLDTLFQKAEMEYSHLGRNDTTLTRIKFRPRPFDETLRLLLEQANSDYTIVGDVYYVFDIQRNDVLKRHHSVIRRSLEYLDAKQIVNLFPSGMLKPEMLTVDVARNTLILSGSLEALGPVQRYIDSIDVPINNRNWYRHSLDFLAPDSLSTLLPQELAIIPMKNLTGTNSIMILATVEQNARFFAWLNVADKPMEGYPINLRFISANDLLTNLPPSFDENDFKKTQNPNIVFFQGSRQKLKYFRELLNSMDIPIPQIRYDLLVIQYQKNEEWKWNNEVSINTSDASSGLTAVGDIFPVLGLTFDITSNFGHQFSVKLSNELKEGTAKVVADSSLNGLSGEKLTFRNTNTFRYQDSEKDTNGNTIRTNQREITSGLFIDIEGQVSGDNMITMKISTTISKQLTASAKDENLPPTSEKKINTHIRTEAGKPVIIGGLTQQEFTKQTTKIPVLGSIPILGLLFRKESEVLENTEFVVYIVPHIKYDRNFRSDDGGLFEHIYEKYIES